MLLIDAKEAALAIGGKCGGSGPEDGDPRMLLVLNYILPRVEAAMNVHSLVRQSFVDHFYLSTMPYGQERPQSELLLSNGFIVPGSVSITDPDGTITTGADVTGVDYQNGVVRVSTWGRGVHSIAYTSGFEPSTLPDPVDPDYDQSTRVLQNVPAWMKALAVTLLVTWFRSVSLNPRVPKEISFSQLDQLLRREVYARVYEHYQRPRVGVVFSERMDRVA